MQAQLRRAQPFRHVFQQKASAARGCEGDGRRQELRGNGLQSPEFAAAGSKLQRIGYRLEVGEC